MNDAFKAILQVAKPSGLSFATISAERESNNAIAITVSGVSETRDDLLLFKQSLENSNGFWDAKGQRLVFKNIYFPPESWIKSTHVDFYLTFQIVRVLPNEQ